MYSFCWFESIHLPIYGWKFWLLNFFKDSSCTTILMLGFVRCALWPSSLFLSEFILSYQEVFSKKFCFEVIIILNFLFQCWLKIHVEIFAIYLKLADWFWCWFSWDCSSPCWSFQGMIFSKYFFIECILLVRFKIFLLKYCLFFCL